MRKKILFLFSWHQIATMYNRRCKTVFILSNQECITMRYMKCTVISPCSPWYGNAVDLSSLMEHMAFVQALSLVHRQRSYHEGCSRPIHPNASHIHRRHRTTTSCYDTFTRLPNIPGKNRFHYSMVIGQKFLYRKTKKTKLKSDHIFLDASNADQLIYYTILDFHAIHVFKNNGLKQLRL